MLRSSDEVNIPNYKCYRIDRKNRIGGGTAIFIKQSIEHHPLTTPTLSNLEATQINIDLANNQELTLIAVYNPSQRNIQAQDMDKLLTNKQIMIAGDLNAKNRNWHNRTTNRNGRLLQAIAETKNITIDGPEEPTHYATNGTADMIDIMILQNSNLQYDISVAHALSSDHLPIISNHGEGNKLDQPINKEFIDWEKYKIYLNTNTTPNPTINDERNLESAVSKLQKDLQSARQAATVKKLGSLVNPTTFPPDIKALIREKNRALKRARLTQDPMLKREVNRKQSEVKNKIKAFLNEM